MRFRTSQIYNYVSFCNITSVILEKGLDLKQVRFGTLWLYPVQFRKGEFGLILARWGPRAAGSPIYKPQNQTKLNTYNLIEP